MLYSKDWWTTPDEHVTAINPDAGSGTAEDVAADYTAKLAAALGTAEGEVTTARPA